MIKECLWCKKEFNVWNCKLLSGKGKYCSKSCYFTSKSSRESTIKRFWSYVEILSEDECWLWGISKKRRYGSFVYYYKGRKIEKGAHVFSYLLNIGKVHKGEYVCHTCDNGRCVNPKHLFLGSPLQNMQDKMKKGRHRPPIGERSATAKLTEKDVIKIRKLLADGCSRHEISDIYNISYGNVTHIANYDSWSHLHV